ncbi:MAG: sulfotransferase [Cyanobacteriota bacterium]|nr:sulfotransferase [Cyanobacteriota bacterium]
MSKTLIVTGMHRSGTSLVTHYLAECGLSIGNQLLPADIGNPLGYFEDTDFLDLHRDILKKNKISTFPSKKVNFPIQLDVEDRQRALEIVGSKRNFSQWGFKDPRTTLMLDFWLEIIESPSFLFLVRHPLTVSDSLVRRGTDRNIVNNPTIALKAWKIYNEEILKFATLNPEISLVINIDDFIKSPQKYVQLISEKFQFDLCFKSFNRVFSEQHFNVKPPSYRLVLKNRLNPLYLFFCVQLYDKIKMITQKAIL